jgi:hypothetical protein
MKVDISIDIQVRTLRMQVRGFTASADLLCIASHLSLKMMKMHHNRQAGLSTTQNFDLHCTYRNYIISAFKLVWHYLEFATRQTFSWI